MRLVWTDDATHREPVGEEIDRGLRRRGAIIMSLFALVWALGVPGLESPTAQLVLLVVSLTVSAALVLVAIRANATPVSTRPRRLPSDWNLRYNLVGLVPAIVIVAVIIALLAADLADLIPGVVCLVVGIHFFPLARIFDQSEYLSTGLALCAVAVIGLLLFPFVDDAISRGVVGFGAAIVLWGTAFAVARSG